MAAKEQSNGALHYVKRNLKIMVVLKALGSFLAQIGLWKAGETPVVGVVALPMIILLIGFMVIDKKITAEWATKMARYIVIFYAFLVLSLVGNIVSFLIKTGFLKTIPV